MCILDRNRTGSKECPQYMFWAKNKKYVVSFHLKINIFIAVKTTVNCIGVIGVNGAQS